MTRRRKATAAAAAPAAPTASVDLPTAASLADEMGGLGVGSSLAAASGIAGAPPAAAAVLDPPAAAGRMTKGSGGGGGAGPSNASRAAHAPSATAMVAAGHRQAAPSPSPPAEDKSGGESLKACAGCGAVGKCLRCSRCRLVFYCSKDCQASEYAGLGPKDADETVLLPLCRTPRK